MGHDLIIVEGGVAAANSSSRIKSSGFRRACYGINAAGHRDFGYREHSLKARAARVSRRIRRKQGLSASRARYGIMAKS
jgi:hypothetical protein